MLRATKQLMVFRVSGEESVEMAGQGLRLVDGDEGPAIFDPHELGVVEVVGESFGVGVGMSSPSRAQAMRAGR